jgi:hypothetical protein
MTIVGRTHRSIAHAAACVHQIIFDDDKRVEATFESCETRKRTGLLLLVGRGAKGTQSMATIAAAETQTAAVDAGTLSKN